MLVRFVVVAAVALPLAACAPQGPEPGPSPTTVESASPAPVAAPGEAAIPLGCADLLAVDDLSDLGPDFDDPVGIAVDESRIAVDWSVARLQTGALHCVWASRYAASDFHTEIELWVEPTDATALDPAQESSGIGEFEPVDAVPGGLVACTEAFQATDDPALFTSCDAVTVRDGYRIELSTSGIDSAPGRDSTVTTSLLANVDAAVAAAGPARVVEPIGGSSDPATRCTAPELTPVLDYFGAEGSPAVGTATTSTAVTSCGWDVEDEFGDIGLRVEVLPGGAWALPRLATGISTFWVPTAPSADGTFLIGSGDSVSGWRTLGDDLVAVFASPTGSARDGWAAFLEATW